MGRGGRGGGQQAARRAADLTDVITVAEKSELSTLIETITETLYHNISKIFDSPPVTPVQGEQGDQHWLLLPLSEDKENQPPHLRPSNIKKANRLAQPSADRLSGSRTTHDTIEPQLQELRKEALAFFRKWQTAVIQRIRDISIRDANISQTNFRGRGRGPRGARGGRTDRGIRGYRGGRGNLVLNTGSIRTPSTMIDRELARKFPPTPTSLWTLSLSKRKLLFHIVLLSLLSLHHYSAYSRALLLNVASSLSLPLEFLQQEETRLAQALSQVALDTPVENLTTQKQEEGKSSRRRKSGFPNAPNSAGAGSLAEPLIAIGIGTSDMGYGLNPSAAAGLLGPVARGGVPVASLFGIYAAKPTSKMVETFAREIQDFALMPLGPSSSPEYTDARQLQSKHRRLRFAIYMNGYLTDKNAVTKPWKFVGSHVEAYVLRWESTVLLNIGIGLDTVTKSTAWSQAKHEITSHTIFKNLVEAKWPQGLLKVSKIIDNPWSIGLVRAEKTGSTLADAIMRTKIQGDRPVSLIGYRLAARAIYACLMVLAERRQFGIVESVVLMGTPAPSESQVWLALKSVVSGRLVNVYSAHDYLLGFLHRTANIHSGVAGLQQILGADGVENYNAGKLISSHLSYSSLIGKILWNIGWEDLDRSAYSAETKMDKTC